MEDSAKPRDLEDRTPKALGAKLTKGSSRFTIALGVRARVRAPLFGNYFSLKAQSQLVAWGSAPGKGI